MAETVTIPREEYDLLLNFSEEFIRAVQRSRKAYREGRYRVARTAEERKRIFREI